MEHKEKKQIKICTSGNKIRILQFCVKLRIFLIINLCRIDTLQLREELHKIIDSGDETFVRVFYAMASEYNKNIETKTEPFTKAQFIKNIIEAEKQIEEGDFLTIEDFEKIAESWT